MLAEQEEVDVITKLHFALCIAALYSLAAIADQFMIRDIASGAEYGPFTYTNNAVITINDKPYEIRRVNTAADRLIERMKSIVIPRIEFRQANIRDVISFMTEASEAADPDNRGVSIALSQVRAEKEPGQPKDDHTVVDDPWITDDPWNTGIPQAPGERLISLNLRRVTLYDALSIIAELADLHYRIDERGIVFLDDKGGEIPTPRRSNQY